MSARSQIKYQSFRCPDGHEFRLLVISRREADDQFELWYQLAGDHLLPVPKCPVENCLLIGDELGEGARSYAQVPESERFEAWLSPDGQLLSVPGEKGKPMPERYRRAGYQRVQASNIRDLDRFDRIRARQTGNDAYNEMNYNPAQRREREEAEYSDDMTSET